MGLIGRGKGRDMQLAKPYMLWKGMPQETRLGHVGPYRAGKHKRSKSSHRNVTIYYKQKHAIEDLIWSHWALWDGVTIRTWNQETLTILQTSTGGSLRYILGLVRWGLRVEYSNLLRGPRWSIVDKNTSGWLYKFIGAHYTTGWVPCRRSTSQNKF